ncbi:MAG: 4Fe-4S binding protein [Candidatus Bathyarchaeota archaeon]|jgi:pyruvate ferredoxin oxidoreductase delta subunit
MTQKKTWKEIPPAGVCWKPSTEYLTGDWKTYMPIRDIEKCTRCTFCVIYCPDGAIHWDTEKEDIKFDYDFCKGCGICANECPVDAIKMERE